MSPTLHHPIMANIGRPNKLEMSFNPRTSPWELFATGSIVLVFSTSRREKGWVEFETSMRHAEDMLKSKYYEHADDRRGGIRVGCQECVNLLLHPLQY